MNIEWRIVCHLHAHARIAEKARGQFGGDGALELSHGQSGGAEPARQRDRDIAGAIDLVLAGDFLLVINSDVKLVVRADHIGTGRGTHRSLLKRDLLDWPCTRVTCTPREREGDYEARKS